MLCTSKCYVDSVSDAYKPNFVFGIRSYSREYDDRFLSALHAINGEHRLIQVNRFQICLELIDLSVVGGNNSELVCRDGMFSHQISG